MGVNPLCRKGFSCYCGFVNCVESQMSDSALDALRPSQEAKKELSKILERCREQSGCTNWRDFCALMLSEAGIKVTQKHFEDLYATTYVHLKPAPIFAIHGWTRYRSFTFPNGESVNASTLADVALGHRNSNGDLTLDKPTD